VGFDSDAARSRFALEGPKGSLKGFAICSQTEGLLLRETRWGVVLSGAQRSRKNINNSVSFRG